MPHAHPQVLAGAFTQGSYSFTVGNQPFQFKGLEYSAREVDDIATALPGTRTLLNSSFNRDAIVPTLNKYSIIHFATHAAFVQGQPEESFILFGDGNRATLRDIGNWSLRNVDLVVLSACQTALGIEGGSGSEILGLGYQMQRAGAKATIATLWSIDDAGTQELMNALYASLKKGNVTATESLRQAQIKLITSSKYQHPYYWAGFILIGNGLTLPK